MKAHTSFRMSGVWSVFDNNGHYVGEISKTDRGYWKPSFGWHKYTLFETLNEARAACV